LDWLLISGAAESGPGLYCVTQEHARARYPKQLIAIKEFKHYELYHGAGFRQVMSHTTEWFDRYLKKEN